MKKYSDNFAEGIIKKTIKGTISTKQASIQLEEMVQSKKFEQTFLHEYMAIKPHESDIERCAMATGREQGLEKGRAEGKTDAAVGMLKFGLPLETVEKCTGLSVEYLKTLV